MKKTLLFLVMTVITIFFSGMTHAQTTFSQIAPTGQLLWYYQYDNTVDSVWVIAPNVSGWGTLTKPSGNLSIPDKITRFGVTYHVKGILSYAFKDCSGLRSVEVGNDIEIIGISAFNGCSGMKDITLGRNMCIINDSAFYGCSSLEWIKTKSNYAFLSGEQEAIFNGVPDSIPVYVPCSWSIIYSTLWSYFSNFVESFPYSVSTTVNYSFRGKVEISGEPTCQSPNITLTAIPENNYRFVAWGDGNTSNPRSARITSDTTFNAIFELASSSSTYTITVQSADTEMGTVTGGGTYDAYSNITITAVPNPGYSFLQWQDGNKETVRTIFVTADKTYTAYFQIMDDIANIDGQSVRAYTIDNSIVITGAAGKAVKVIDMSGRIIENKMVTSEREILEPITKGIYLVQIDNLQAIKVLIK